MKKPVLLLLLLVIATATLAAIPLCSAFQVLRSGSGPRPGQRRLSPSLGKLLSVHVPVHVPAQLPFQREVQFQLQSQATPSIDDFPPQQPPSNPSDSSESESSVILAGTSPKVIRLRKQLQEIWTQPNVTTPVFIMGPAGSGKFSIAQEIVNRLPKSQTQNVHKLNMNDALFYVDSVLGLPDGSQPGLLDELADQENTTLLLQTFKTKTVKSQEDFERREELRKCVQNLLLRQVYYSRYEGKEKPFKPRIIATCLRERGPDFIKDNPDMFLVKVPALDSRNQDMEAIANAEIKQLENSYGLRNVTVSHEAVQRLLDHPWEICDEELVEELGNALELLALDKRRNPDAENNRLLPKHMLVNSFNEKMRRRLLYDFPILRNVIESPWVFDHTLRYIVTPAFILTLALLFLGPQAREHNTALTYFWGGWWPLVMLSYPFLGRIWCSICPFMAIGNLAQDAVTKYGGVKLKKWPDWIKTYGTAFAFSLFFAILMWEELWTLPESGVLSAYLLLLITSGAVFNSVQFENRAWCRYLCPVGAMCKTFGTMSIIEVRSWKNNCEGCTNPQCVNGDSPVPEPTDAFALKGCTMQLKNNQLKDMGDCTLCMSCVKNCEREVPEVNTRPIGLDFGLPWLIPPAFQKQENLALSQVETNFWLGALITILQGSVLTHYMPRALADIGFNPSIALATPALDLPFIAHFLATAGLLALPGLLSLAVDKASLPIEMVAKFLKAKWEEVIRPTEQQSVIDLYSMVMERDLPFQEILREFDPDGDGMISCWECQQALKQLNVPQDKCDLLVNSMSKRFNRDVRAKPLPIEAWLDHFQEMYLNAKEAKDTELSTESVLSLLKQTTNQLQTKKTFVEIFNDIDKDGDGFITTDEIKKLLDNDREWKTPLTEQEKLDFLSNSDLTKYGRLNLFQFMSMMRKIVRVGIQEIGYGYLPLAWASLTAYWLGIGMSELGLVLTRLPDTFYLDKFFNINLPGISIGFDVIQPLQALLVIGAVPISIGLTQKLCDDNKISGVRFGLHAAVQILGAAATVHLMISTSPLAT